MADMNRPNWVRERAECEIGAAFENLCAEVKRDVDEMQPYIPKVLPPNSTLKTDQQKTLFVVRCDSDYAEATFCVTFSLRGTDNTIHVEVEAGLHHRAHTITTAWNSHKECCDLFFDEQSLAPWSVSEHVLGPLFFREG